MLTLEQIMAQIAGFQVGATEITQTGEPEEIKNVYSDILALVRQAPNTRMIHCNSVMLQARDTTHRITVVCQPLDRWDGEYRVKTILTKV